MEREARPQPPDRLAAFRALTRYQAAYQTAVQDGFSNQSMAAWLEARTKLESALLSPGKFPLGQTSATRGVKLRLHVRHDFAAKVRRGKQRRSVWIPFHWCLVGRLLTAAGRDLLGGRQGDLVRAVVTLAPPRDGGPADSCGP
jgi:hypothetical protein